MKREIKNVLPFRYKMIAVLLLFIGAFLISIVYGAADIRVIDVWLSLTSNVEGSDISIIREIRLPREVAAVLVGAALSIAGAMMQGMTRNPLADPGLLGLTAGANAALAVAIVLFPTLHYFGVMVVSFLGAAIGAMMVYGISAVKRGGFSPFKIILAGAAVSAFLQAVSEGIGIYFKVSKDVSMWTAGGLIGTTWGQLQMVVPFMVVSMLIAFGLSRQLTILSLNEEVAVGLGQKTTQIKAVLFIIIVLLAGASVALVGNMAFIGLMVPHMVRVMVGTDYRYILPMSAFVGAILMLFADTLARTINAPWETPIVAIISVMGLPFFLLIIRKGGRLFI
ncbi:MULTISPECIES: FecCD family ABC transporter permease [Oceanobacillus]|uniref:FecCD family ABC transporter permease n=1 Tax=Oceanobacillus TaxID=182709 RepID=UPI000DA8DAFB|nr:iron ABC transporter permease [Bacilli bacterium]PZD89827.1 iron ABC transporter permease [Bacilli bacterium]RCO10352.1 iron ABC transporter permease [Bacilli bacterium]RCT51461.1 iron ABC transporter permease [Bacilli bacterium]